jgi:hypothetical protein
MNIFLLLLKTSVNIKFLDRISSLLACIWYLIKIYEFKLYQERLIYLFDNLVMEAL